MEDDARVQAAALMGEMFKIDPIDILKSDHFDWMTRMAAHSYVVTKREEAAAREAKKKK